MLLIIRFRIQLKFYFKNFADPNDTRKVIVKKLALVVADRDDMELDLSGDISKLKKEVFKIKEGVQYKIRIEFIVQREIVHGLKYVQKTFRLGVPGNFFFLFYFIYLKKVIDFIFFNDFLLTWNSFFSSW